eukprot:m.57578 g.57578  ORF g.57578 m.57578 type:complete len:90 (-) comp13471_c0_seq2:426-695(-)
MEALRRNKFVKFGLPMIIFMVAGSLGLREFWTLRLYLRDENNRKMTEEEVKKLQQPGRQFNPEQELQALQARIDITKWEQTRVPRPDEK